LIKFIGYPHNYLYLFVYTVCYIPCAADNRKCDISLKTFPFQLLIAMTHISVSQTALFMFSWSQENYTFIFCSVVMATEYLISFIYLSATAYINILKCVDAL